MNENRAYADSPRIEFRRLVTPLPTGRVRVQIEVRQQSGGGEQEQQKASRLLGKIIQVRGGWRFVPIGGVARVGQIVSHAGKVWATAEECKRSLQEGS